MKMTDETKQLLEELIPVCKQALEIVKKYPEVYNNNLINMTIGGNTDYINIFQMKPTGELKADGKPKYEYILDYCSYDDVEGAGIDEEGI